MSPQQLITIKAIETLEEKIHNNKDCFSDSDIKQLLTEIKSVHSQYKNAFNKTAFTWQVQHYSIQMALENKYKFIFSHNDKMTWTLNRWKFALINELAIHNYNCNEGDEMVMDMYGVHLMCFWLFFQYFNASVFNGSQCMEVLNKAFQFMEDADDAILETIKGIKQWRIDNDKIIRDINSDKTQWRQERARINRLLNGRMMLKEIERCHILHYFHSSLSFKENIDVTSGYLGVSEKGLKRKCSEYGINEMSYKGMLYVYRSDDEIEYKRQYEWAKKVKNNALSTKEKKEFWSKFRIPNPQHMFRTFPSSEPDLIPAENPLLTTEEYIEKSQELPKPNQSQMSSSLMGDMWQLSNIFKVFSWHEDLFS